MKKIIMILGLLVALVLTCASTIVPSKADTNVQKTLGDFARDFYPNIEGTNWNEKAITALNVFESRKNQKYVKVFSGSQTDCENFATFFNTHYAFSVETMVTLGVYSDGSYGVYFENTNNADAKIQKYKEITTKAKNLANSLKGNTQTETVNNIINYIQTNAVFDVQNYMNPDTNVHNKIYYGFYDGNKIVCRGYAITFCQLCRFNGIRCEVLSVVNKKTNTRHAINKVYFDGQELFVDTTWQRTSKTLFDDFVIVNW